MDWLHRRLWRWRRRWQRLRRWRRRWRRRWQRDGYGYGCGDGDGYGNGYGNGYGDGSGDGDVYGDGGDYIADLDRASPLPARITSAVLRRAKACQSHVDLFAATFPAGAAVYPRDIDRARSVGLDIEWAHQRLALMPVIDKKQRNKGERQ